MNEYLIYAVIALAVALGYLIGRWHGVIHERDVLRDLVDLQREHD